MQPQYGQIYDIMRSSSLEVSDARNHLSLGDTRDQQHYGVNDA